jgi:D-glycero-alpha-D-manno-heptose-7-phosphate kinase
MPEQKFEPVVSGAPKMATSPSVDLPRDLELKEERRAVVYRYTAPSPQMVVTRTPMRVSFAGGGTDLPDFYNVETGAVLSATIDKYVYVTVKRHSALFDEPIRVNYSQTEQVNAISEIQNDIARECLRFLNFEPPIYVSTVGDMPASSGMGGSSVASG